MVISKSKIDGKRAEEDENEDEDEDEDKEHEWDCTGG